VFEGTITSQMRGYVIEMSDQWHTDTIWNGCSGNFTVARTMLDYKHHGNDVTIYSCALGWWASGQDVPITLKPDAHEQVQWMRPFFDEGSPAEKVAAIMLSTAFFKSVGQRSAWHERNVGAYKKQWPKLFEKTLEKVNNSRLKLESFAAKDVLDWLRDDVPEEAAFVSFPPFYCLAPDEKILTADLEWVRAGDILEGQKIIAFDEEPQPGSRMRRWSHATVTRSEPARKELVRVTLENGDQVTCSVDHPWLTTRGWVEAQDLVRPAYHHSSGPTRATVLKPLDMWEVDDTRDGGWLAGMLDGEGTLGTNTYGGRGSATLSMSQVEGPIADRFEVLMRQKGFDVVAYPHKLIAGQKQQVHIEIRGGFPEILRALGILQPTRLIDNLERNGIGQLTVRRNGGEAKVKVVAVEHLGRGPVQSIATTSRTYVGAGYLMHNSNGYENMWKPLEAQLDWEPPHYKIMGDAEKQEMFDLCLSRPYWFLGLQEKPEQLLPYLRGIVQTTAHGMPVYLYASKGPTRVAWPRQAITPVVTPRLTPRDELTGEEKVTLAELSTNQFAWIRSQHLDPRIKTSMPGVALAVLIDGKIAGCIAFKDPDGKYDPHFVYMLSDFPVAPTRYRRLAALIVRCAQSTEVQQVLARNMVRHYEYLGTTAFTDNIVSMKYRTGGLKIGNRVEGDDGHKYRIAYSGQMGRWPLQQAYTEWFKTQSKHQYDPAAAEESEVMT
jgi:hypothetical protein